MSGCWRDGVWSGWLCAGRYQVDVAVKMGCGDECPLVRAKQREDWQIPDPRDMTPEQFRGVRDLIERKVKDLLAIVETTP